MRTRKETIFFRIISILISILFIYQDIVWAYPANGFHTLAKESALIDTEFIEIIKGCAEEGILPNNEEKEVNEETPVYELDGGKGTRPPFKEVERWRRVREKRRRASAWREIEKLLKDKNRDLEAILSRPVSDLDLSNRAVNVLGLAGVETINDFLNIPPDKKLKGCAVITKEELDGVRNRLFSLIGYSKGTVGDESIMTKEIIHELRNQLHLISIGLELIKDILDEMSLVKSERMDGLVLDINEVTGEIMEKVDPIEIIPHLDLILEKLKEMDSINIDSWVPCSEDKKGFFLKQKEIIKLAIKTARSLLIRYKKKISGRQEKERFRLVYVNKILHSVLTSMRSLIKEENILLDVKLFHYLPLVKVDKGELKQVFVNLIKNAIESIDAKGKRDSARITVRTSLEKDRVVVSIADTGLGIEEKDIENISKPYFTTKTTGQGLGLYICKGIIEGFGGRIEAKSAGPGEGAEFRVILPYIRKKLYQDFPLIETTVLSLIKDGATGSDIVIKLQEMGSRYNYHGTYIIRNNRYIFWSVIDSKGGRKGFVTCYEMDMIKDQLKYPGRIIDDWGKIRKIARMVERADWALFNRQLECLDRRYGIDTYSSRGYLIEPQVAFFSALRGDGICFMREDIIKKLQAIGKSSYISNPTEVASALAEFSLFFTRDIFSGTKKLRSLRYISLLSLNYLIDGFFKNKELLDRGAIQEIMAFFDGETKDLRLEDRLNALDILNQFMNNVLCKYGGDKKEFLKRYIKWSSSILRSDLNCAYGLWKDFSLKWMIKDRQIAPGMPYLDGKEEGKGLLLFFIIGFFLYNQENFQEIFSTVCDRLGLFGQDKDDLERFLMAISVADKELYGISAFKRLLEIVSKDKGANLSNVIRAIELSKITGVCIRDTGLGSLDSIVGDASTVSDFCKGLEGYLNNVKKGLDISYGILYMNLLEGIYRDRFIEDNGYKVGMYVSTDGWGITIDLVPIEAQGELDKDILHCDFGGGFIEAQKGSLHRIKLRIRDSNGEPCIYIASNQPARAYWRLPSGVRARVDEINVLAFKRIFDVAGKLGIKIFTAITPEVAKDLFIPSGMREIGPVAKQFYGLFGKKKLGFSLMPERDIFTSYFGAREIWVRRFVIAFILLMLPVMNDPTLWPLLLPLAFIGWGGFDAGKTEILSRRDGNKLLRRFIKDWNVKDSDFPFKPFMGMVKTLKSEGKRLYGIGFSNFTTPDGRIKDFTLSLDNVKTGDRLVIVPDSKYCAVYGWIFDVYKADSEDIRSLKDLTLLERFRFYKDNNGVVRIERIEPKERLVTDYVTDRIGVEELSKLGVTEKMIERELGRFVSEESGKKLVVDLVRKGLDDERYFYNNEKQRLLPFKTTVHKGQRFKVMEGLRYIGRISFGRVRINDKPVQVEVKSIDITPGSVIDLIPYFHECYGWMMKVVEEKGMGIGYIRFMNDKYGFAEFLNERGLFRDMIRLNRLKDGRFPHVPMVVEVKKRRKGKYDNYYIHISSITTSGGKQVLISARSNKLKQYEKVIVEPEFIYRLGWVFKVRGISDNKFLFAFGLKGVDILSIYYMDKKLLNLAREEALKKVTFWEELKESYEGRKGLYWDNLDGMFGKVINLLPEGFQYKWANLAFVLGVDEKELRRTVLEYYIDIFGSDLKKIADIVGVCATVLRDYFHRYNLIDKYRNSVSVEERRGRLRDRIEEDIFRGDRSSWEKIAEEEEIGIRELLRIWMDRDFSVGEEVLIKELEGEYGVGVIRGFQEYRANDLLVKIYFPKIGKEIMFVYSVIKERMYRPKKDLIADPDTLRKMGVFIIVAMGLGYILGPIGLVVSLAIIIAFTTYKDDPVKELLSAFDREDFDKVLSLSEEAIRYARDNVSRFNVYNAISSTCNIKEMYRDAVKYTREALKYAELELQKASASFGLGIAYYNLGKYEMAIDAFNKARRFGICGSEKIMGSEWLNLVGVGMIGLAVLFKVCKDLFRYKSFKQVRIGNLFYSGQSFELKPFFFTKVYHYFMLWLRKDKMRWFSLGKIFNGIVSIPKDSRFLIIFKFRDFMSFLSHYLPPFAIIPLFSVCHSSSSNNIDHTLTSIADYYKQISSRISLAIDKIQSVFGPSTDWLIVAGLFNFLGRNTMVTNMFNIPLVPLKSEYVHTLLPMFLPYFTNYYSECQEGMYIGYGFMGSGWLNLAGAGIVILALISIWVFIFKEFGRLMNLISREKSKPDGEVGDYSMLGHLGASFEPSDNSKIPYWEELVRALRLNVFLVVGPDSGGLCKKWAESAWDGLNKDKGLLKNHDITRIQLMHSGYVHYWIEIDIGGVTYLFDRTAGHFDSNFPLGWYGKKENVPDSLSPIYDMDLLRSEFLAKLDSIMLEIMEFFENGKRVKSSGVESLIREFKQCSESDSCISSSFIRDIPLLRLITYSPNSMGDYNRCKLLNYFTKVGVFRIMKYILDHYPEYKVLVDMRPVNNGLLAVPYVGYDMAVKKIVNPYDRPLVGVYGGAGADISNFLLSTNAVCGYFVDHGYGIEKIVDVDIKERVNEYLREKYEAGYAFAEDTGGLFTDGLSYFDALIAELLAIGVSEDDIAVIKGKAEDYYCGRVIEIRFKWAYPGQEPKERIIYLIPADITKPSVYPSILRDVLSSGIDLYYQNTFITNSSEYNRFVKEIVLSLKENGFLVMPSRIGLAGGDENIESKEDITNSEIIFWSYILREYIYEYAYNKGYGWDVGIYRKMDDKTLIKYLFPKYPDGDGEPEYISLYLKENLKDASGSSLWRRKEWTQTELADRKPAATVIIDNTGVDIGDGFRERIKEIFQLDEGGLDRTMEMIMEVFKYRKEEFLKRRMIEKEEIRLYIVPKSQGLSGDYKDNGIVFINLLAIKELLRHYRETPVSPYMEGLLEKLAGKQSLIVNERPVPKEDEPKYEPEWESLIIGLFIGVSLSHEIYGHEIGISDEKRLTRQDMQILTRFIPGFKGRDLYSRLLYAVMNVFSYESNFTRPLFKWLVEKGLEAIGKYFEIEHIKDIITELGKDLQLSAGLVDSIQLLGKVLLLEFMEEELSEKLGSYIKAQIGLARGMALLECKLWSEAIKEFEKGFGFFHKRGIHIVEKKDDLEWWLVRYPSYVGLLLHIEDYRNAGMEIERFFRLSRRLKGVYGDRLYKQEWYIDMLYLRGKYFVFSGSKCNNKTMLEKGVKYLEELLGCSTETERARGYDDAIYFDIGYVYFILARFRDAVGMLEKSERYKSDTARLIKLCQFVEKVKEKDFAGAGGLLEEYLKEYYTEVDLIDETVYFASLCLSTFTDEEIFSLCKNMEKERICPILISLMFVPGFDLARHYYLIEDVEEMELDGYIDMLFIMAELFKKSGLCTPKDIDIYLSFTSYPVKDMASLYNDIYSFLETTVRKMKKMDIDKLLECIDLAKDEKVKNIVRNRLNGIKEEVMDSWGEINGYAGRENLGMLYDLWADKKMEESEILAFLEEIKDFSSEIIENAKNILPGLALDRRDLVDFIIGKWVKDMGVVLEDLAGIYLQDRLRNPSWDREKGWRDNLLEIKKSVSGELQTEIAKVEELLDTIEAGFAKGNPAMEPISIEGIKQKAEFIGEKEKLESIINRYQRLKEAYQYYDSFIRERIREIEGCTDFIKMKTLCEEILHKIGKPIYKYWQDLVKEFLEYAKMVISDERQKLRDFASGLMKQYGLGEEDLPGMEGYISPLDEAGLTDYIRDTALKKYNSRLENIRGLMPDMALEEIQKLNGEISSLKSSEGLDNLKKELKAIGLLYSLLKKVTDHLLDAGINVKKHWKSVYRVVEKYKDKNLDYVLLRIFEVMNRIGKSEDGAVCLGLNTVFIDHARFKMKDLSAEGVKGLKWIRIINVPSGNKELAKEWILRQALNMPDWHNIRISIDGDEWDEWGSLCRGYDRYSEDIATITRVITSTFWNDTRLYRENWRYLKMVRDAGLHHRVVGNRFSGGIYRFSRDYLYDGIGEVECLLVIGKKLLVFRFNFMQLKTEINLQIKDADKQLYKTLVEMGFFGVNTAIGSSVGGKRKDIRYLPSMKLREELRRRGERNVPDRLIDRMNDIIFDMEFPENMRLRLNTLFHDADSKGRLVGYPYHDGDMDSISGRMDEPTRDNPLLLDSFVIRLWEIINEGRLLEEFPGLRDLGIVEEDLNKLKSALELLITMEFRLHEICEDWAIGEGVKDSEILRHIFATAVSLIGLCSLTKNGKGIYNSNDFKLLGKILDTIDAVPGSPRYSPEIDYYIKVSEDSDFYNGLLNMDTKTLEVLWLSLTSILLTKFRGEDMRKLQSEKIDLGKTVGLLVSFNAEPQKSAITTRSQVGIAAVPGEEVEEKEVVINLPKEILRKMVAVDYSGLDRNIRKVLTDVANRKIGRITTWEREELLWVRTFLHEKIVEYSQYADELRKWISLLSHSIDKLHSMYPMVRRDFTEIAGHIILLKEKGILNLQCVWNNEKLPEKISRAIQSGNSSVRKELSIPGAISPNEYWEILQNCHMNNEDIVLVLKVLEFYEKDPAMARLVLKIEEGYIDKIMGLREKLKNLLIEANMDFFRGWAKSEVRKRRHMECDYSDILAELQLKAYIRLPWFYLYGPRLITYWNYWMESATQRVPITNIAGVAMPDREKFFMRKIYGAINEYQAHTGERLNPEDSRDIEKLIKWINSHPKFSRGLTEEIIGETILRYNTFKSMASLETPIGMGRNGGEKGTLGYFARDTSIRGPQEELESEFEKETVHEVLKALDVRTYVIISLLFLIGEEDIGVVGTRSPYKNRPRWNLRELKKIALRLRPSLKNSKGLTRFIEEIKDILESAYEKYKNPLSIYSYLEKELNKLSEEGQPYIDAEEIGELLPNLVYLFEYASSLEEISSVLGLTKERARQLILKAVSRFHRIYREYTEGNVSLKLYEPSYLGMDNCGQINNETKYGQIEYLLKNFSPDFKAIYALANVPNELLRYRMYRIENLLKRQFTGLGPLDLKKYWLLFLKDHEEVLDILEGIKNTERLTYFLENVLKKQEKIDIEVFDGILGKAIRESGIGLEDFVVRLAGYLRHYKPDEYKKIANPGSFYARLANVDGSTSPEQAVRVLDRITESYPVSSGRSLQISKSLLRPLLIDPVFATYVSLVKEELESGEIPKSERFRNLKYYKKLERRMKYLTDWFGYRFIPVYLFIDIPQEILERRHMALHVFFYKALEGLDSKINIENWLGLLSEKSADVINRVNSYSSQADSKGLLSYLYKYGGIFEDAGAGLNRRIFGVNLIPRGISTTYLLRYLLIYLRMGASAKYKKLMRDSFSYMRFLKEDIQMDIGLCRDIIDCLSDPRYLTFLDIYNELSKTYKDIPPQKRFCDYLVLRILRPLLLDENMRFYLFSVLNLIETNPIQLDYTNLDPYQLAYGLVLLSHKDSLKASEIVRLLPGINPYKNPVLARNILAKILAGKSIPEITRWVVTKVKGDEIDKYKMDDALARVKRIISGLGTIKEVRDEASNYLNKLVSFRKRLAEMESRDKVGLVITVLSGLSEKEWQQIKREYPYIESIVPSVKYGLKRPRKVNLSRIDTVKKMLHGKVLSSISIKNAYFNLLMVLLQHPLVIEKAERILDSERYDFMPFKKDKKDLAIIPSIRRLFGRFGESIWYEIFFGPAIEEILFRGSPVLIAMGMELIPVPLLGFFMIVSMLFVSSPLYIYMHPFGKRGPAQVVAVLASIFVIIPFLINLPVWFFILPVAIHSMVNIIQSIRNGPLALIGEDEELKQIWHELGELIKKIELAKNFREKEDYRAGEKEYVERLWFYISQKEKLTLRWIEVARKIGIDRDRLREVIVEGLAEIAGGDVEELGRIMGIAKGTVESQYIHYLPRSICLIRAIKKAMNNKDLGRFERIWILRELFEKEGGRYLKDPTFPTFSFTTTTIREVHKRTTKKGQKSYFTYHIYFTDIDSRRIVCTEGIAERYGDRKTYVRIKTHWDDDYGWLFGVYEIDPETKKELGDNPDLIYRAVPEQNSLVLINPLQQTVIDAIEPRLNIFGEPIKPRHLNKGYVEGKDGLWQIQEMARCNRFRDPSLKIYPFFMPAVKEMNIRKGRYRGIFEFGALQDKDLVLGMRRIVFFSFNLKPNVLYFLQPYFSKNSGQWFFLVYEVSGDGKISEKPILAFSGKEDPKGRVGLYKTKIDNNELAEKGQLPRMKETPDSVRDKQRKVKVGERNLFVYEVSQGRHNRWLLQCIEKGPWSAIALEARDALKLLRNKESIIDIVRALEPGIWTEKYRQINTILLEILESIRIFDEQVIRILMDFIGIYPDKAVKKIADRIYNRYTEKRRMERQKERPKLDLDKEVGHIKKEIFLLSNDEIKAIITKNLKKIEKGKLSLDDIRQMVIEKDRSMFEEIYKEIKNAAKKMERFDVGAVIKMVMQKYPWADDKMIMRVIEELMRKSKVIETPHGIFRVDELVIIDGLADFGKGRIVDISIEEDMIVIEFPPPKGQKVFLLSGVTRKLRKVSGGSLKLWMLLPILPWLISFSISIVILSLFPLSTHIELEELASTSLSIPIFIGMAKGKKRYKARKRKRGLGGVKQENNDKLGKLRGRLEVIRFAEKLGIVIPKEIDKWQDFLRNEELEKLGEWLGLIQTKVELGEYKKESPGLLYLDMDYIEREEGFLEILRSIKEIGRKEGNFTVVLANNNKDRSYGGMYEGFPVVEIIDFEEIQEDEIGEAMLNKAKELAKEGLAKKEIGCEIPHEGILLAICQDNLQVYKWLRDRFVVVILSSSTTTITDEALRILEKAYPGISKEIEANKELQLIAESYQRLGFIETIIQAEEKLKSQV